MTKIVCNFGLSECNRVKVLVEVIQVMSMGLLGGLSCIVIVIVEHSDNCYECFI